MADSKISSLTELAETPAATDEFVVVDKSDTTMAASGTNKRVQAQYLTISDATTTAPGKVELATTAETETGTDATRAVTPDSYRDAFATTEAAIVHAATEKTTPVDADELGLIDSADSYALKKTSLSDIKSILKTDEEITSVGVARQAIMNGNFDVWQRGTSFTPVDATEVVNADRWKDYNDKNSGTLPTLTRSRQLLTSGDIPNAFYFSRLNTNGAGSSLGVSSRGVFYHRIENGTRNLCGSGKKVTVSFWARSDISNKRICPTLEQGYGTGGTPTATEVIKGTPITLTSAWTKYTATFTTNTLVGKTFGTAGDDQLQVNFYYMWGTTAGNTYVKTSVTAETFVGAGNIDIAQVQLCAGDVALPFQPKSFVNELRDCQRYYEKSYNYETALASASGLGAVGVLCSDNNTNKFVIVNAIFKVSKRATPTMSYWDVAGNASRITTWSNTGAETQNVTPSVGMTAGANAAFMSHQGAIAGYKFQWSADAEL